MPRDSYHHGDLRSALIGAARDLVRAEGAQRVSLRAIARAAGVSAAAPYHHFEDREAILAAVAAEGFASLRQAMEASAGGDGGKGDPFQRLQGAGVAYVSFAAAEPELYRLMFSGLLSDRSRYPELRRAADDTFRALQQLLAAASPGEREPTDGEAVALTAWSTVHGLAMLLIDGLLEEESRAVGKEELSRRVTRVLGRGLRHFAEPGAE
jgi:AcrR family transcriptional regulator